MTNRACAGEVGVGDCAGSGGDSGHVGSGPVVVLSYAHSGAQRVQEIVAADTGLAYAPAVPASSRSAPRPPRPGSILKGEAARDCHA
jgi:hypothetical protein